MADYLIKEETLQNIANTIRILNGDKSGTPISVSNFSSSIQNVAYKYKQFLTVISPANSTVDIIKNNIVVESYAYGLNENFHTFTLPAGNYEIKGLKDNKITSNFLELSIEDNNQYLIELKYKYYLYKEGNEFTDITGGWNAYNYTSYDSLQPSQGYTAGNINLVKNANNMIISQANFAKGGSLFTNNKIDLTNYKKFCWEGSVVGDSSNQLQISSNKQNSFNSITSFLLTSKMTYGEINIENLTGSYYPVVWCGRAYVDSASTVSTTITSLWLE